MSRFVAFLRGINVGGHRVKMDRLAGVFAASGGRDVATFIASGNVIFTSGVRSEPTLRGRLEQALARELGYAVPVLLRTPAEVRAVVAFPAFAPGEGEAEGHSVQVLFLNEPPGDGVIRALEGLSSERDVFRVQGREVYWLSRGRLTDSPVTMPILDKALARAVNTMRNRTTLRKLAGLLDPGPAAGAGDSSKVE
ncbi:MAG: DUF1697 domain-containing protein [Verrucomicrobiales bacterium]|nr:DUF1697 domain-containing protein [Verrucomicrobiales bacterium]